MILSLEKLHVSGIVLEEATVDTIARASTHTTQEKRKQVLWKL